MQVDYAGLKIRIVNPETGEVSWLRYLWRCYQPVITPMQKLNLEKTSVTGTMDMSGHLRFSAVW